MKTAVKTFLASIIGMLITCLTYLLLRLTSEHVEKSLGEHLDFVAYTDG